MATSDIKQQQTSSFDGYDEEPEHDGEAFDPSAMSLIDHLEELRGRIFKCLIAVVIGAVAAFIFRDQIMQFLAAPLPNEVNALSTQHGKLVVIGLTEGITITLLISLAVGVVVALPVLLYQIWAFVAPGLYEHEKKYAVPFIFIGIVLFAIGVGLAYVVLKYPVEWLVNFSKGSFTQLVTADSYYTFVAIFLLVFGIIFEMPLVLTFLAKVGIVSGETLRKKRAVAHVGMWLAACFLTPGADLYSPIILGVAMSCLYELTIIFIRIAIKEVVVE